MMVSAAGSRSWFPTEHEEGESDLVGRVPGSAIVGIMDGGRIASMTTLHAESSWTIQGQSITPTNG